MIFVAVWYEVTTSQFDGYWSSGDEKDPFPYYAITSGDEGGPFPNYALTTDIP